MTLHDPVRYRKGVGPKRAAALGRAGIESLHDLLTYYPRKHYDRGDVRPIRDVRPGEAATILGQVIALRDRRTSRKFMHLFEVEIKDESGSITAVWFNQAHLKHLFRMGDRLIVTGQVQVFRDLQIQPVEFEVLGEGEETSLHARGMVPAYTVPDSFGGRGFRELIFSVLREVESDVVEILPERILSERNLMGRREALHRMHFPTSPADYAEARRRMAFEEFFLLQCHLALKQGVRRTMSAGVPLRIGRALDFRIRALFPFSLTSSQDRVLSELRADLTGSWPMNRLLQGDVGSGKTVVALYALLAAVGNRSQAALLAPTEILAEQHLQTFQHMLGSSRVRLGFLGGGVRKKKREEILSAIAEGEIDLVIGTHAVLEKDVVFKNLAMIVIDEQQKFGVLQRANFREKGAQPHTLVMTATPIPRTLSLTVYGDLDVSVLKELPPGRKEVITLQKRESDLFEFVRGKLVEGRQAFFVYPLVNDSDKIAAKSATSMCDRLAEIFSGFSVALLHGRMKADEKAQVMEDFRSGKISLLVSTVVVEVGIDVPNASVMVIGNAERYGLSQLHQLRGRIGRGSHVSYCLVLAENPGEVARQRLEAFVGTSDGFRIAEADLSIRGPGEIFGTRQSGSPEFRAANPILDVDLLGWAREDAFRYLSENPGLKGAPALLDAVHRQYGSRSRLATVG
ncbi:MAG: ATP-dependent DNA helicase RecG [Planctomycetota bacterium]|nr:ATP-dependent DNA helicase RecG [Planctomycetota bacterium]